MEFYQKITTPVHLLNISKLTVQKKLSLQDLLRRLLMPGQDIGNWASLVTKLGEEKGFATPVGLIIGVGETYPRMLYNDLKPFNPRYYMRERAMATARLIPPQTFGVYSVENQNRLMSATEALGHDRVVPRTREQIASLSMGIRKELRKVENYRLPQIATQPKSMIAYFQSMLPKVMSIANDEPTRQDVTRMPWNHFIDVGTKAYQFAYQIDGDLNPPVLRYGYSQTAVQYLPSYFAAGIDPVLKKVIDNKRYYWLAENRWMKDEPEPGTEYLDVLEKYVYSNGTPPGSVGRIETVSKVRSNVALNDRLKIDLTFTDVNSIGLGKPQALKFEKPRVPGLKEFASLPDMIAYFDSQFVFEGSEQPFSSVNINMNSSTGIWSGRGNKKNSEVNVQTLFCLAEDAMRLFQNTGGVPASFYTGIIKNKAEVYERDETMSKTRNIIAFNFPATVLIQMVQYPVFKNRPTDPGEFLKFQEGPLSFYSYNVAGYSPTNSFFQKMYGAMQDAAEGSQFLLFMSDNLWIADKKNGEVRWLSLDGAKMECSHMQRDVDSFLSFMKKQYEWDPDTWAFYKNSVEKMMVGAEGLLGQRTYFVEQLTSGFPETAGINCIKMARIVKYLILLWNHSNHDIKSQEADAVVEHYRSLSGNKDLPKGRTLYELWLSAELKPAFTSEGVTMTETIHNPSVLETLTYSVSALDFLGFDFTMQGDGGNDPNLEVVFPVLEKSRIIKAMVFNKTVQKLKDLNEDERHTTQAAVGMSKTTSLMLAGGWAHEELRSDLQAMFYNYQTFGQNVDKNLLADSIANDLHELGFGGDILNLSETMPNMDTIAKIFLTREDYFKVRSTLDAFLRDEGGELLPIEADFYAQRAQDKSFVVSMLPIGERFEFIQPGDFSESDAKPAPEEMDRVGIELALNNALFKIMDHGVVSFSMSESFYTRSLESAVAGIKGAIISDLRDMASVMFPQSFESVEALSKFITKVYGFERAPPLVSRLKEYHQALEVFQVMLGQYVQKYSTSDYHWMLYRKPNQDLFDGLKVQSVDEVKYNMAVQINEAKNKKDLIYSVLSQTMREEILYIARERIKSEVFLVLLRRVIIMPDQLHNWTASHMGDMFAIHINQLTAFEMCREAHDASSKLGKAKQLKSSPFSLVPLVIQMSDKKVLMKLPMNSSIKRSALSHCLANLANIPGSVRKTETFKSACKNLYLGMSREFQYRYIVKTNTTARLRTITNPIVAYPARQIVSDLRHVSVVQTTQTGMYHSYLSIMYQNHIIDSIPATLDNAGIMATVSTIRKTLESKNIGVTEVLTYVKSALLNTSSTAPATMVAILKALPTFRTDNGPTGFEQAIMHPTEVKASTVAVAKLIGSDDHNRIAYLMSQVWYRPQHRPELLDLRRNIEAWCSLPRSGYPDSNAKLMKLYNAIWKAPKDGRVLALCAFLMEIGTVLTVPGSFPDPLSYLNTQYAMDNPWRYYVELLGYPAAVGKIPDTEITHTKRREDQWLRISQIDIEGRKVAQPDISSVQSMRNLVIQIARKVGMQYLDHDNKV